MSSTDLDYLRERAATERNLALTASDPAASAVHAELAGRYEALIKEAERPKLKLVKGKRTSQAA